MTGFWALDYLVLAIILASAVLVVVLRNLNGAVMALSATGTMLSLLFVILGAPDVAHSEVVVGAIALPVLYLVAIGKTRAATPDEPELDESQARDAQDGSDGSQRGQSGQSGQAEGAHQARKSTAS